MLYFLVRQVPEKLNPVAETTKQQNNKTTKQQNSTMAAKKAKIPLALREEVWRHWMGEKFKSKCCVTWCTNQLTAFDFAVGHNIPESKGGTLELSNLRPICNRCNTSMGSFYTIDEWNALSPTKIPWYTALCCCSVQLVPPNIVEGVAGARQRDKEKNGTYVPPPEKK